MEEKLNELKTAQVVSYATQEAVKSANEYLDSGDCENDINNALKPRTLGEKILNMFGMFSIMIMLFLTFINI
jgi:hypothetical protein